MAIRKTRNPLTILLVLAALVVVAAPAGYFVLVYGCGEREDRLAAALAEDPALNAAPDGARKGESYRECDDDDLFVSVGAEFSHEGSSKDPLARHREAARAGGWRPSGGDPDCYTKRLDGTTAYLSVDAPSAAKVELSITADRQGSEWC
ncbi:hypothetical protein GCM10010387_03240 [Streptomyces inusitatus]|uniref:Uncharacterized protein n=1 Tax=Streptomyces inusitatus TaxID=68221 RepID=A0A918PKQ3_9ACTN|nr:hypothetical protein [Streptomyces inusitatus]GGZ14479.1 hypothetical protein GCM10010387_03240 [Streptomyces inusitatus]